MSQNRRPRGYSRVRDAMIRDLRRVDGTPSVVAGYLPGNAGRPKPHPGDEKFPFVKDPPDIEGPTRYIEAVELSQEGNVLNPIPLVADFADYLVLDQIDVGGWRLLTFFIEFFPDDATDPDGVLSIIPEQTLGDTDEWFPVGFVDGVVTPSTITGLCAASRESFAMDIRFNETESGVAQPSACRETLDFDVTTKHNMRLRVGDVASAASGLNLWYTLTR